MTANIARGPLTDLLWTTLHTSLDFPVGDGRRPAGGGWAGSPNSDGSNFTPYVIIVANTATESSGPFDQPQGDWHMPYSFQYFGVARNQVDALADKGIALLSGLRGTTQLLGAINYRIQQVHTDSIGGIVRTDVTDPPYFGRQDGMSVWLTRSSL